MLLNLTVEKYYCLFLLFIVSSQLAEEKKDLTVVLINICLKIYYWFQIKFATLLFSFIFFSRNLIVKHPFFSDIIDYDFRIQSVLLSTLSFTSLFLSPSKTTGLKAKQYFSLSLQCFLSPCCVFSKGILGWCFIRKHNDLNV